ncbi:hypothetical protein BV898_03361 [Hypsibius exemplaris]|uniref:Uncharacterized protein n=1 Tax=Hypsibius exemplaris TaxID=2072580 RepID=A0A1W0X4V4_HYPEX|nr:hypothetical protein BV898_03361 [Hypsibius exemplaris]
MAGNSRVDYSFKEIGVSSSMPFNKAGTGGNGELETTTVRRKAKQNSRKATINVTIFGQVWVLEVEITDIGPEECDIYLNFADSYIMLEGQFC